VAARDETRSEETITRSREWIISREQFETEDDFRNAVAQELAAFEHLGFRTGRALVATPLRLPTHRPLDAKEDWITVGWTFREVFVPAARLVEPEPEAPSLEVLDGEEEPASLEPVA
jgi:hypothetical protein